MDLKELQDKLTNKIALNKDECKWLLDQVIALEWECDRLIEENQSLKLDLEEYQTGVELRYYHEENY